MNIEAMSNPWLAAAKIMAYATYNILQPVFQMMG
jgi:hypothetical protein